MPKKYVLDSSVLLYSPYALNAFDEHDVIIPGCVLKKMHDIAVSGGENRAAAAAFGREMDALLDSPGKCVELSCGGLLQVIGSEDKNIYEVAAEHNGTIVTRNPLMRVIARTKNIPAEPFRYEQGDLNELPYMGRCILYVSSEEMAGYAADKKLTLDPNREYCATGPDNKVISDDYTLTVNEYVTLLAADDPSKSMLGRFDGKNIVPLRNTRNVWGVRPLNAGQRFALDALMNPDIPLVILKGPAGTAKTFLSMAAALEQTVEGHMYKRILLTRPNIKMDADVGFLKGDEQDKVLPILRGLLDNIENLSDPDGTKRGEKSVMDDLLASNVVEPQAMAYMRGRSIVGQYIIADEMQNSSPTQSLSIITRIGARSKIVLCGDVQQIDSPFMDERNNGLSFAAGRMKGSPLCAQLTFTESESTRSELAGEAIARMSQRGIAEI